MFIKFEDNNNKIRYYPINTSKFVFRNNNLYLIDGEEEINLNLIGASESVQRYLENNLIFHQQQPQALQPGN